MEMQSEAKPKVGLRAAMDRRFTDAWEQKTSFEPVWQDIGSVVLPSRTRLYSSSPSQANRGDRTGNSRILDGTATQSVEVARAGMMTGMASPSRPWHDLVVDGQMRPTLETKRWLDDARDVVLSLYDRSNFYATAATVFGDGMVFGTAPMLQLEDHSSVVRFESLPIGSYAIAQDDRGIVDSLFREFSMTISQIINQFGKDNLTQSMRNAMEGGRMQTKFVVRHAIIPNADSRPGSPFVEHLPYMDVYWESGEGEGAGGYKDATWTGVPSTVGGPGRDGILRVSGFHEAPFAVARWDRNNDDVYATSYPGVRALGDIKQLQQMVRDRTNAINKMVNPSLVGGPGVKGRAISLLAGAVNVDPDMTGGNTGLRPLHDVRFQVRDAAELEEQTRQRIRRFFYEDLFLMLLGDERLSPLTATETVARERERLSVLGPVLERHSDDFFDPTVKRTLAITIRLSEPDWAQGEDGMLPIPPAQIEGVNLRPR